MRKTKLGLAAVVFIMAGIGLITKNNNLIPYMFLFLGAMMFVQGVDERKKKSRSVLEYASFTIAAFVWFISLSLFLGT